MAKHIFEVKTCWSEGRNAVGTLQAERLQTNISIPPEMAGPGIGTNPDEMLLGAAATCYIISLAALLEHAHIEAMINNTSEGQVDVTNGVYTYEKIVHHVTITLQQKTEQVERRVQRLSEKAERTCMISKALKGNVDVIVKLHIL